MIPILLYWAPSTTAPTCPCGSWTPTRFSRIREPRQTPGACTDWSSTPGAGSTRAPIPAIICLVSTRSRSSGSLSIKGTPPPPTGSRWTPTTGSGPAAGPTPKGWACSIRIRASSTPFPFQPTPLSHRAPPPPCCSSTGAAAAGWPEPKPRASPPSRPPGTSGPRSTPKGTPVAWPSTKLITPTAPGPLSPPSGKTTAPISQMCTQRTCGGLGLM